MVTAYNTLDGISFTMPSCRCILRHGQEEVVIDALALQLRMEGMAARMICAQYMDSEVADSMQMIQAVVMKLERDEAEELHVSNSLDQLAAWDENPSAAPVMVESIERRGSTGLDLETAIAAVCKNETEKGEVTYLLQKRTELLDKTDAKKLKKGIAHIALLIGKCDTGSVALLDCFGCVCR